mmetsp:Transcript_4839/g.11532  ORF Transcript_4839/g.11532 Transcript_4839/m.11532 type:complete len:469 (-) Transcript_4839:340-1746(-)
MSVGPRSTQREGTTVTTMSQRLRARRCVCRFPLYAQVLVAIVAGILLGWLAPNVASNPWIKAMGTLFVKMVKMVIAPIIFCTVVSGIAHVADAAKVGRVAMKAIIYFEVISTLALVIGLLAAELVQPGRGINATLDPAAAEKFAKDSESHSTLDFVSNIIPATVVGAFAEGEILQVLFFSLIFGFALIGQGDKVEVLHTLVDQVGHAMFGVVGIVMRFAPLGAFGAMAFTVGKYGIGTLQNLMGLVATNYIASFLFVVVVLGSVGLIAGVNIFRLLLYIKQEILLALATSSSESVLPSLMQKLEAAGLSKPVVGLVVPLGYSFNLDGTNIYMTLTTLFISQAMGVELTLGDKLKVLSVAMLTSKGAAGVAGAGFITLAATLGVIHPEMVPGMAMVLGIDKFMGECRTLTNICGNAIAAVVVAILEGELDRAKFDAALANKASDVKELQESDAENPSQDAASSSTLGTS